MRKILVAVLTMPLVMAAPLFAGPSVFPGFPNPSDKPPLHRSSIPPEVFFSPSLSPSATGAAVNGIGDEEISFRGAAEVAVFKKAASSVVLITTLNFFGTGGVISDDGLIVTNWHVVEDAPQVAIVFKPSGLSTNIAKAKVMSAKVVLVDKQKDLALLQLLGDLPSETSPIEMGSIDSLEIGQDTHAIGHPSGYNWTYTKGFVSSYREKHEWSYEESKHQADVIQTQTPINPGNSGGPLLNNDGQLIGVNSYVSEGESLNFSVSVEEVKGLVDSARNPSDGAVAECEVELVFEGRNTENDADLRQYDRDCDSIIDAATILPDDGSEALYAIFDDDQDGTVNGYVFDENRDGMWNISYWDTTGDGEMDTQGNHPDGELFPSEYVEIS
jgi:S1-C subfamily serine protease